MIATFEVATAWMSLDGERVVLQRRPENHRINPGMLGMFGGHIEAGETPRKALVRELTEETDLTKCELGSLSLAYVDTYELGTEITGMDAVKFYVYGIDLPREIQASATDGLAEIHEASSLHLRSDLSPALMHLVGLGIHNA